MLSRVKHILVPEFSLLEQERDDLRAKIRNLEAELHLHKKIKDVADMRLSTIEHVNRDQDRLQSMWIATAGTMDHVRNSMANTAETAKQQRQQLSESSVNYQQIKSLLHTIANSFGDMEHKTSAATAGVEELTQAAHQIDAFLSEIKSIADQTNLLALNAAIEAARAGEQGRGFAVVAEEVRALASKTTNASTEISDLIHTISDKIERVSDCITQTNDTVKNTFESTRSIANIVDDFTHSAQSMSMSISIGADIAFIQTVKLDHVVWKTEVYQRMWKKSEKSIDAFSDHTQCRLGQWYYQGEGALNFKDLQAFKKIEPPHIQVHKYGILALNRMEDGDIEESLQALQKMESASETILDLLSELEAAMIKRKKQATSQHNIESAESNTEYF